MGRQLKNKKKKSSRKGQNKHEKRDKDPRKKLTKNYKFGNIKVLIYYIYQEGLIYEK